MIHSPAALNNKDVPKEPISPSLVLGVGLVFSFCLWIGWLYIGMEWARSATSRHAAPVSAKVAEKSLEKSSVAPAVAVADSVGNRERVFAELGQTGDSFGSLNALLTSIAGVFVGWAGYLQHLSLKQARHEAGEERVHRERQAFESLFFQLLQLSTEATSRIERANCGKGRARVGPRALDSYARSIFDAVPDSAGAAPAEVLDRMVKKFLVDVYDQRPSAFGPYFRLLFQTFKHVLESDLSDAEKIRYTNIARGQVSEGAVLLLALNGLTSDGHKFAPLIEKFGLLEHLHRRYRKEYGEILLTVYRPRAFMGSEDRALPMNTWDPRPLFDNDRFAALEKIRSAADHEADFASAWDETDSAD